jgi:chemotaxis signal transduction protein
VDLEKVPQSGAESVAGSEILTVTVEVDKKESCVSERQKKTRDTDAVVSRYHDQLIGIGVQVVGRLGRWKTKAFDKAPTLGRRSQNRQHLSINVDGKKNKS